MHVVLASSIAVLLVAAVTSLALLRKSGDPRASLLTVAFALLAATQALALWSLWPRALGIDVPTLAVFLALGASLVCPFLVRSLDRTLRERDRSESLHWNSMETVRALADLAALSSLELDARLTRLLDIGREQFGLDIGVVSRVKADRYEVVAIRAPQDLPLRRGAAFPLDATWCRLALESARPFDLADVSASGWAAHPARAAFPFEAYLGSVVRCKDEVYGTLAFASVTSRRERFTATEKDLLTLMACWLGRELERGERTTPVVQLPAATPLRRAGRRLSPGWQERRIGVGPQAPLRAQRSQRKRSADGHWAESSEPSAHPSSSQRKRSADGALGVHSESPQQTRHRAESPEPSALPSLSGAQGPASSEAERRSDRQAPLGRAQRGEAERRSDWQAPRRRQRSQGNRAASRFDLNATLRKLERRLRRAAGADRTFALTLAADLEPARDPRIPLDAVVLSLVGVAVAAQRAGGTLEVATANLELGASAPGVLPAVAPDRYVTIAVRAFGSEIDADALSSAFHEPRDAGSPSTDRYRLSLSTLYRLLQRCGGDLSVDVERGRGARFTVFLPRAAEAREVGVPAQAPAPSPPLS